ncbi:MAG: GNAT family N-acetyltransferase [Actinomycetota bacterium]
MSGFVPVNRALDLSQLDCGNASLDRWLRTSALQTEAMRTVRTFVWDADGVAVAYYAVAAHSLPRHSLPPKLAHGAPSVIPAYLLAKLALSRRLQGRGLGALVLREALNRCLHAGIHAGARLVVVDAIDHDAARFYESQGFTRTLIPGRLARKLSDVAEAYLASGG